ncbi:ABC transporter substrate-binding protein [Leadbettera azotonutricia]|uniref:Extracellular solute-binding protein, family 1 n=1 Tax=Leadbettera azotonutricia (strain ATCC BAA-888 / DSM 13862 / ZAS-9) TaxID=545695 RepID=F5YBG7_LEAAZ|nr:extracellular solute-binding protein [Leadbettera azotonutricia]AEF81069.1 extracellular solute-binding protein, family 1 [Leadbettera azotonutricia ZAS-9]
MKKVLLLLTAVLVLALGCSKKESSNAASSSGGGQKVHIVVGGWPSADVGFDAALPGFYAQYPDIEVEVQMAQTEAYHQALQTSLAAGQGAPDVAMIEGAYIAQYRDSTALINLLDAPYNAERYKSNFVALKWNQAYSSDGKRLVAFAWDLGPSTFYYRQDILKELGLPTEPEDVAKLTSTWSGMLDLAKKVNIPGQRWLLNEAQAMYMEYFNNRDFYNEKLELQLDRPGDLDCLNAVIAMRKGGLDMNANMWSSEGVAAIDNGAVVGIISGAWFGGFLKDDFDPDGIGNWRATVLPGNIKDMNLGGSFCAIPEQSKQKDAAWKFLEYMLATKKGQNDMFAAVDYFPAFEPAWDDPIYQEPDPYFGGQKTRALYKQLSENLDRPVYATIMDVTVEAAIGSAINTGIERNLGAQALKTFIKQEIETATAELKRQQIQTLRDAGVWKD